MFKHFWAVVFAFLCFVNLLCLLSSVSFGSGGDDAVGDESPVVRENEGFIAWVSDREQVRDSHLLVDVHVLVHPNVFDWPGVVVEAPVGEFKEVVIRVDIVLLDVSVPSRSPYVYRERSRYERERRRGREAVEFLRNVIFAADGDLFLEHVRPDGTGRFEAVVSVVSGGGQRRSLNELLDETGHGVRGDVRDWGARRVREVK